MPRIARPRHAAREGDCVPISLLRSSIECRSTGKAESEQSGHLVEGLTGGVVDSRAQFDNGLARSST